MMAVAEEQSKEMQKKTISHSSVTYEKQKRVFKIIVVGDSNVGKTCLTYRFCEGKFLDISEATIGVDFRERLLDVNGEEIKLQLWDTAGQERFRKSMVQHYYRNVHAVVIVYDVTNAATFESLSQWIEECNRHNLTSSVLPRILVGNKCDCKEKQVVKTNIAQQFADKHDMPLFETSAKAESECDNVEAIFLLLAHKLKSQRPMMTAPTNSQLAAQGFHKADVISITRENVSGIQDDGAGACWC